MGDLYAVVVTVVFVDGLKVVVVTLAVVAAVVSGRIVVLGSCIAVLAFVLFVYFSVRSVVCSGLIVAFSSFSLVSPNFFFFLNWFVSITLHTLTRGTYAVVAVVVRRGATVVVVVGMVRRGALVVSGIFKCCDG